VTRKKYTRQRGAVVGARDPRLTERGRKRRKQRTGQYERGEGGVQSLGHDAAESWFLHFIRKSKRGKEERWGRKHGLKTSYPTRSKRKVASCIEKLKLGAEPESSMGKRGYATSPQKSKHNERYNGRCNLNGSNN